MQALEPGQLFDATGTPIPVPLVLPPETFTPSLTPLGVEHEVQDRYRGYPSKGLTPSRIEAILEAADLGEPHEWIELCEEMQEKDPKIGSVLHTRTASVLGLVHEVRAPKLEETDGAVADEKLADEIAKFCDNALDLADLDNLLGDLMDSIGKPLAVDWIVWGRDESGKVVPKNFICIPAKHLRWGTTSETIRVWSPAKAITSGGEVGTTFEPYTTVRALNNERRDHPTRAGLLRSLVWPYLFKNTNIKDWVSYADRYGLPQRILSLRDSDFRDSALYEKARAALRSLGNSATGVISKEWDLQIAAAASKGSADLFLALIQYIDTAIAQLVLGHELTSQGSAGGGRLGISAAIQVRQDILEGDCAFLAQVIRRDLLTPMVAWNFGAENLRLTPYLVFDNEPPKDLVAESNVLSTIARTFPDFQFSQAQLRERYGYDMPLEQTETGEDDAITAGQGAAAGGTPLSGADPSVAGDVPQISINSAGSGAIEAILGMRKATLPKSKAPARQKVVDKLLAKSIRQASLETAKWKSQLRGMIREGLDEGLTLPDMAQRIAKAYPDFDVSRLETLLHEQLLLVRLFGRQS